MDIDNIDKLLRSKSSQNYNNSLEREDKKAVTLVLER